MSHMAKLDKANVVSATAFEKAAEELGLKTERGGTIRDWAGKAVKCDVAVRTNAAYDLGIQKSGKKFDMLGDFSMMRVPDALAAKIAKPGQNHARGYDLADRLLALTTKHTLVEQYRRQGFTARVSEDKNRNITVSLTR